MMKIQRWEKTARLEIMRRYESAKEYGAELLKAL